MSTPSARRRPESIPSAATRTRTRDENSFASLEARREANDDASAIDAGFDPAFEAFAASRSAFARARSNPNAWNSPSGPKSSEACVIASRDERGDQRRRAMDAASEEKKRRDD